MGKLYKPYDALRVELLTLDAATYAYYSTLNKVITDGGGLMTGGTQANPKTNLSNGALDHFGGLNHNDMNLKHSIMR